MQGLNDTYRMLIDRTDTSFVRYLHDRINWHARLIAILGARGVGKTTLILQHIKLYDRIDESLYVSADDFYFAQNRLFDLAVHFYQQGGKRLYIDEIHKYKQWSTEIKNIYDRLPDLQVVYTGSSILEMEKGGADLSRRKLEYTLYGLSLREYINISHHLSLPAYSLEEVVQERVQFPMNDLRPLQQLTAYLRMGYFPFFREDDYTLRLDGILKQITEFDIPHFVELGVPSVQKLKKLLYMLAQSVPFKPNYSKLERDLEIRRTDIHKYMFMLEKAGLISLLPEKSNGIKILEKIDKVYLQNPNIAYLLSNTTPDVGSIRESIFFAWLKVDHYVTASPIVDFEVEGLSFEIGGKNKGAKQLANADRSTSYIVRDNIEYPSPGNIPLWMFGFLY